MGFSSILVNARRAALFGLVLSGCCPPQVPIYEPPAEFKPMPNGTIIAVGDTQRTHWAENIFLLREQNDDAREALVRRMVSEEHPAFLVHMGDMVSYGASSCYWTYFDQLFAPFQQRKIPMYAAIGNHDLWGSDTAAFFNLEQRFPDLAHGTYYVVKKAGLALVFLNSNLADMDAAKQAAWFAHEMPELEQNNDVAGIIVVSHHPPFTLGRNREGDRFVNAQIMDTFFAQRKAVLFLSGHVHGYERFSKRGRAFIVSGGGGGPRVKYRPDDEAPQQDPELVVEYHGIEKEVRPLNYVVLNREAGLLRGEVKCVPDVGCDANGELDHFTLAVPGLLPPPASSAQPGSSPPPASSVR